MAPIERITLFKIPNEADVPRVLEQYKLLAKTATKVRAEVVLCLDFRPGGRFCAGYGSTGANSGLIGWQAVHRCCGRRAVDPGSSEQGL